ncbi:MAG: PAS domain S-box protein [Phycisphaerae bacterium]|nr:PAS domain S-box protein [Phycisphaerae bacterium]
MTVVFFIYGLAFFLMGFAILLYPKKGSSFALSGSIKFVACFGIIHGINEWLDLFIGIEYLADPRPLEIIRSVTLPVSFVFLLIFSSKVLITCSKKSCACRFISLFLVVLWAVLFLFGSRTMLMWDIWSRYILCVPGAFLTGLALLLYVPQVEPARVKRITQNLKIAGFAFMAYALFAGVIVKKADIFPASLLNYDSFKELFGGIPVQVFRSGCAVIIAYSLIRVLEIFHWEIKRDLNDSRFRFSTVAQQTSVILFTTDKDNNITFIEGKGLDSLGISGKEVIGHKVSEVFGDEEVAQCCQSALLEKDSVSTFKVKDCVLQLFSGPLKDRGHIEGAIGVVIDITAERKKQAELSDYRERMLEQKTLAEIGTLSTEMVQKLSTPVASIKASLLTALVALRKMPDSHSLRKPLENSLEHSSEAMEIIDKFFSFANITPNPKAEPIDIEQIVSRVLAVFRDRINQAMLRVETSGIDVVPCMYISSHEMEQVFFAVVQNVVQSATGNEVADFSIKCDQGAKSLRIVFSDNLADTGYDDPNDIFEPFSTAGTISKNNSFGLVVLKRLVLAYNGTIDAKRQDDRNLIEINLPVQEL